MLVQCMWGKTLGNMLQLLSKLTTEQPSQIPTPAPRDAE